MPGSYKCPKGGNHEWTAKKATKGPNFKTCKKCGQSRPS